jgi:hypothetical protein
VLLDESLLGANGLWRRGWDVRADEFPDRSILK